MKITFCEYLYKNYGLRTLNDFYSKYSKEKAITIIKKEYRKFANPLKARIENNK
jgi:hypothetical protein